MSDETNPNPDPQDEQLGAGRLHYAQPDWHYDFYGVATRKAVARYQAPPWPEDEVIPEPTRLPTYCSLPMDASPRFVGRQDEMRQLIGLFRGDDFRPGTMAAITGADGVGKTQLACEFAHRYGQFFAGGVFWVPFEDADSIGPVLAALGHAVGWCAESAPLDQQLEAVAEELRKDIPRLLIFDNVEDEALLSQWQPKSGGCRILITSQIQSFQNDVAQIELDVLNRPQSIELLGKLCPRLRDDIEGLDDIAAVVGDFPLALHVAGSSLYQSASLSAQSYLEIHKQLSKIGDPNPTFAIAYDRIKDDPLALHLLDRGTILQPGQPFWDLLLGFSLDVEAEERDAAIDQLTQSGLLETMNYCDIRMHSSVAAYLKPSATDEARDQVLEFMSEYVQEKIELQDPKPGMEFMPQLLYLVRAYEGLGSEELANMYDALGKQYHALGDYERAVAWIEKAIALNKALFPEGDPILHAYQNNLGWVLKGAGDYEGARTWIEKALQGWQAYLKEGSPQIADCRSRLGIVLQHLGDHEAAREQLEKALAADEQEYEADDLVIAFGQSNLATVLHRLEDFEAARKLFEKALAIELTHYDEDHPTIAESQSNLAFVLQDLGDPEAARTLFEKALASDSKHYEANHPAIAIRQLNLGTVLLDLGQIKRATELFEIAQQTLSDSLGDDHGYSQSASKWLASAELLSSLLGDSGDAE
jgi:tetratricopeptide (TPR) repeat protein